MKKKSISRRTILKTGAAAGVAATFGGVAGWLTTSANRVTADPITALLSSLSLPGRDQVRRTVEITLRPTPGRTTRRYRRLVRRALMAEMVV